jgi:phage terminase large subunit GpA-like protein
MVAGKWRMNNLFPTNHWLPEPPLTVSQWADEHRILPWKSGSAESGRWRTSRTPYLKEPMDSFSSRDVEEITFCSATQIGKTETLMNCLGYIIDYDPGPTMIVLPKKQAAQDWAGVRLENTLKDSPRLARHLTGRRQDLAGTLFELKSMWIKFAAAESPSDLAEKSIRYLFLDELDKYKRYSGREGDPVSMAKERTNTYRWFKKVFKSSTPTNEEGYIWKELSNSDFRRYHVPCPHCGAYQILNFFKQDEDSSGQIVWPEETDADVIRTHYLAKYRCAACQEDIDENSKDYMLAQGVWCPKGLSVNKSGKVIGAVKTSRHVGYHLNALYSPWVSWSDLAYEFLKGKDEESKLMNFFNSKLALPWKDQMKDTSPEAIYSKREAYEKLPSGVLVLTAGVDLQDEWVAIEIVGWGKNYESWSIDYIVLQGSPGRPETWDNIDTILNRKYEHILGFYLTIEAVGVDTGGHFTQEAYGWCKPRSERKIARAYALKGSRLDLKDVVARKRKTGSGTLILYQVGVGLAKRIIYNRLALNDYGPGFMHFPINDKYDLSYFQGLTSEKLIKRMERGQLKKIWIVKGRNEPLDCRVYAYAALLIRTLGYPDWLKMEKHVAQLADRAGRPEEKVDPSTLPDPVPKPDGWISKSKVNIGKKGKSFVTDW